MPEIERQQQRGKKVWIRADAAFAKPEIYEALEERGVKYDPSLACKVTPKEYNFSHSELKKKRFLIMKEPYRNRKRQQLALTNFRRI